MATADRTVNQGDNITLYIEIRNFNGTLIEPDSAPTVSIYDFDSDPRSADTVDADALVLDASSTLIAQGIYSYTYTVGAAAHVGTWFDEWTVSIGGVDSVAVMQFDVLGVGTGASTNEGTTVLLGDNVVIVTVSNITALDGTTMAEDFQYYFTTQYSNLYCSVKQVRLRAGGYMSSVPDDTINLAIFEASEMADAVTFGLTRNDGLRTSYIVGNGAISPTYYSGGGRLRNGPYLDLARTQYACCMAILYILSNSLGPTAKKKRLADFSVDYGEGHMTDFMNDLKKCCEEWELVLNAGGYIVKGGSLPATSAIKGSMHPDYTRAGRLMHADNSLPAANLKVRPGIGRSMRHHYDSKWRSD